MPLTSSMTRQYLRVNGHHDVSALTAKQTYVMLITLISISKLRYNNIKLEGLCTKVIVSVKKTTVFLVKLKKKVSLLLIVLTLTDLT